MPDPVCSRGELADNLAVIEISSRKALRRAVPQSSASIIIVALMPLFMQHAQLRQAQFQHREMVAISDSVIIAEIEPDESPGGEATASEVVDPGEITRQQDIARCLAIYYMRPVDADSLRPWSIMHGLLSYGQESRVVSRGKLVSALEYLCSNQLGNDRRLLNTTNGRLNANIGPGVQGHPGQFLAMLAQSDVPVDQQIVVDGRRFTVKDLIEAEKLGCQAKTELTFRLIGLSHYLGTSATWKNSQGEVWNIERVLREELAQPVNGAACGGTHRLMGISYAVRIHHETGGEFNKLWNSAEKYIADYHKYTYSLQNSDGSFSTEWFERKDSSKSAKKRVYTTGHVLEWLAWSLPDDQLDDPRLTKAVDYLTNLLLNAPGYDVDIGPRGHALRALRIYQERTSGKSDYASLLPDEERLQAKIRPVKTAVQPEQGGENAAKASHQGGIPLFRGGPAGWRR